MLKKCMSIMCAALISGCSCFVPSKVPFSVNAEPEGAIVVVDGRKYTTPCVVNVSRDKPLRLLCKADGYRSQAESIDTKLSKAGILDAVGTLVFLLPVVGFMTDGAWILEDDSVYFELEKK